MGFGGNGAPACPPAHRPRQLQSVSLSPLIKYRATNYFPLMFLLNMGGHNYCSFSLSILAPSRQRDTRILYTHRTKIHTCDRIIRFIRHTRIRHGRRHQRRGGWERCGENDKDTLQTALTCGQTRNQRDWGWLYFLSDHLGGESFHPMEVRVDDSGRGWKTPGWARRWSPHNTRTDERGAEQLQSILLSAGRGRGGDDDGDDDGDVDGHPPRVPEWRSTHVQTHRPQTRLCTFPGNIQEGGRVCVCPCVCVCGGGVTFLFVAMATQASLSFFSPPSHMSRCEQTHTCEVCSAIGADSPLQLVCRRVACHQ